MKTETIDLTPTWSAVLPIYLTVLADGAEEGKGIARAELARMAKLADEAKKARADKAELLAALDGLLSVFEFHKEPEKVAAVAAARAAIVKAKGNQS